MRAYHLVAEEWALQSIGRLRLKLSLLEDMNDPFELMGLEARAPEDRAFFRNLKAEMNQTVGALCFSRDWRNPVLWSHYADKHRGICLGFDIPDEHILQIDYSSKRLKAELEDEEPPLDGKHIAVRLITTKYKHWKYENEVRLLYRLEDVGKEANMYFAPYFPWLGLREVILGPRSPLAVEDVRRIVAEQHSEAVVFKARLAFRTYSVVHDRRSIQAKSDA